MIHDLVSTEAPGLRVAGGKDGDTEWVQNERDEPIRSY